MIQLFLAAQAPAANPGAAGFFVQILPFIVIFGVFWLLIIMPQRKQQKQRQSMLDSLKKGDKVITAGGMHGEIVEIDEEDVKLRVADKVELKFTRSSISRVKS